MVGKIFPHVVPGKIAVKNRRNLLKNWAKVYPTLHTALWCNELFAVKEEDFAFKDAPSLPKHEEPRQEIEFAKAYRIETETKGPCTSWPRPRPIPQLGAALLLSVLIFNPASTRKQNDSTAALSFKQTNTIQNDISMDIFKIGVDFKCTSGWNWAVTGGPSSGHQYRQEKKKTGQKGTISKDKVMI